MAEARFRFTCPSCSASLALSEEFVGGEIRCPKCGATSVAPVLVEMELPGPTEAEATAPSTKSRPCPACGEPYSAFAPRCPHCDEWFDEAVRRRDGIEPAECIPDDDEYLTSWDWLFGIMLVKIGFVLSVVYLCQGRPKWKKLLVLSVAFGFLWGYLYSAARRERW
ncbi:MAG: hypothetical protein AAB434_03215 [Planctomycetota bacterium]